jgi:hypothetical protein
MRRLARQDDGKVFPLHTRHRLNEAGNTILTALDDDRRTGTTHHWRVLARPCHLARDAASERHVHSKADSSN